MANERDYLELYHQVLRQVKNASNRIHDITSYLSSFDNLNMFLHNLQLSKMEFSLTWIRENHLKSLYPSAVRSIEGQEILYIEELAHHLWFKLVIEKFNQSIITSYTRQSDSYKMKQYVHTLKIVQQFTMHSFPIDMEFLVIECYRHLTFPDISQLVHKVSVLHKAWKAIDKSIAKGIVSLVIHNNSEVYIRHMRDFGFDKSMKVFLQMVFREELQVSPEIKINITTVLKEKLQKSVSLTFRMLDYYGLQLHLVSKTFLRKLSINYFELLTQIKEVPHAKKMMKQALIEYISNEKSLVDSIAYYNVVSRFTSFFDQFVAKQKEYCDLFKTLATKSLTRKGDILLAKRSLKTLDFPEKNKMYGDLQLSLELNNRLTDPIYKVMIITPQLWGVNLAEKSDVVVSNSRLIDIERWYKETYQGRKLTFLHESSYVSVKATLRNCSFFLETTAVHYAILDCFQTCNSISINMLLSKLKIKSPVSLQVFLQGFLDIELLKVSDGMLVLQDVRKHNNQKYCVEATTKLIEPNKPDLNERDDLFFSAFIVKFMKKCQSCSVSELMTASQKAGGVIEKEELIKKVLVSLQENDYITINGDEVSYVV